ncbi:HAMP domain-containing protein [Lachnospiraceae bacterium 45-W7]
MNIDNSNVTWQPFRTKDAIVYYGSYAAMIGLPAFYIVVGIIIAAAHYYREKLRTPITQLQHGVERIQEDNLDFHIQYNRNDELGQLCCSMEKMRRER